MSDEKRVLVQGRYLIQMLSPDLIATADTVTKRVRFYRGVHGLDLSEREALLFRDLLNRAFPPRSVGAGEGSHGE